MGSKKYRSLLFSIFLISLTSFSAAQGFNTGSAETAVVDVFNQVLFSYEAQSVSGVLLFFVVPLFGFYFINKNIFEYAFESFGERLGRDNYADLNTNEELPTGLKGVAFVVAFITVQILGTFGTFILLAVGALGAIAWILTLLGVIGKGAEMPSVGGGGSPDEVKEGLDREEERVDEEQKDLDRNQDEIEDAEKTGDDKEARDAAQREEKIIMTMEDIETDILELLNLEERDLEKTIKGAQHVLEEEKREIEGLRDIERRYNRTDALLPMLAEGMQYAIDNRESLTNGNLRSHMVSGGTNGYSKYSSSPLPDDYSDYPKEVNYPGIKHVNWDIEQCLNDVRKVSTLENQEYKEVRNEVKAIQREANNFLEAYDLIQKIKAEIDEMEKEDKELEQIAKELGDRKLMKLVKEEEGTELDLEKKVKKLVDKEDMIEQELRNSSQIIEEELELNRKEIQEIKQEIPETEEIEQNLESIRDNYVPEIDNAGGRNTLNNNIRDMENNLESIEKGLVDIENRKEKEVQMIEDVKNKLSRFSS